MINAPLVVVVTGLSGAGKSTALHALEDLGFFCVDNLPAPVVSQTLTACEQSGVAKIALGIDVRVRGFFDRVEEVLAELIAGGHSKVEVVFLDASDDALLRRFNSTRRPHPLAESLDREAREPSAVLDGVRMERERLAPLRAYADPVIDTTNLSVHDLRRQVLTRYGPGAGEQPRMRTRIVSFGFKYGAPVDADLVLDVRFLENPFFIEALRPQSGRDAAVADYVLKSTDGTAFLKLAGPLLAFLLPRYEREGKSYLTVAIGCTGGRHRSVAISEALASGLREETGLYIDVLHRDIARDNSSSRGRDAAAGRGGPGPDGKFGAP